MSKTMNKFSPVHRLGLVRGCDRTLAPATTEDHTPLEAASGLMRMTSGRAGCGKAACLGL